MTKKQPLKYPQAVVNQAELLYLSRSANVHEVSRETGIPKPTLERWRRRFDWDKKRAAIMEQADAEVAGKALQEIATIKGMALTMQYDCLEILLTEIQKAKGEGRIPRYCPLKCLAAAGDVLNDKKIGDPSEFVVEDTLARATAAARDKAR